jgi:hypothetical protein
MEAAVSGVMVTVMVTMVMVTKKLYNKRECEREETSERCKSLEVREELATREA